LTKDKRRSIPVKDELRTIARAISKLYDRNQAYMKQKSDTRGAIRHLANLRSENSATVISQRRIFVASPNKSEKDVMGAILEVLDEYDIEVVF
jgi:hypothetical protein